MPKFYSIRVVRAKDYDAAVKNTELNIFEEKDELCDMILTAKEARNEFTIRTAKEKAR